MTTDQTVALFGAAAVLITAACGGAAKLLGPRHPSPKKLELPPASQPRATARPREHGDSLERRVSELATELRHVRDRLSKSEASHERTREDVAALREEVDELERDLLKAQIELNKTLAGYMASQGQHDMIPRSRKR